MNTDNSTEKLKFLQDCVVEYPRQIYKPVNLTDEEQDAICEIAKKVYQATIGYSLDSLDPKEGVMRHSDEFLDEHPERRDNPHYTDEEEKEMINFIAKMAKIID